MRRLTCLILLLLLLGAAALTTDCGGDDGDKSAETTSPTEAQTTEELPPEPAPKVKRVRPSPGEANPNRAPKVRKGEGNPPKELVVQDLIVGKGKKARSSDQISVQYVGVLFKSGKQFDSSWVGRKPGRSFVFSLGSGNVIEGWDQGLIGMRVGGRRKLIIPADLAYGSEGFPPAIPPNSALIFDIDLTAVR